MESVETPPIRSKTLEMVPRQVCGEPFPASVPQVRLPLSASGRCPYSHVRVLQQVFRTDLLPRYIGEVYRAGETVPRAALGAHAVVVELAGWDRPAKRRGDRPPFRWILWRYDSAREEWRELSRSIAAGSEWTEDLYEPARRALDPDPDRRSERERAGEITEELSGLINERLLGVSRDLRVRILQSLGDRFVGVLAQAA